MGLYSWGRLCRIVAQAGGDSSMVELDKPKLVIRIGFAGARAVADGNQLATRLSAIYAHIADVVASGAAKANHFYAPAAPVVRLATGLAEGSDLIAAGCFRVAGTASSVVRQSAAVLPFNRSTFRSTLDETSQLLFDREVLACEGGVTELDGRYLADDSPGKAAGFCRHVRTRAYRSQAAFLLRQCDLLLAAYDPAAVPKPAGTVETIRNGLELGMPVVVLPLGSEAGLDDVAILRHGEGFYEHLPTLTPHWREALAGLLEQIIVPPPVRAAAKASAGAPSAHGADHSLVLIRDYFGVTPRLTWLAGVRQKGWAWFEGYFKDPPGERGSTEKEGPVHPAEASGPSPPAAIRDPLKPYQKRASALARHYNTAYRGTFFVNYALAVIAIFFAVAGLRLLLTGEWPGKEGVLFALALVKLAILVVIFASTEEANHHDFNGKGINYRYLAERLRAQTFLTMAGSGRPPIPATIRHATRADHLSNIEWLFQAIVRQAEGSAVGVAADLERGLRDLKASWLDTQARHHEANSAKMGRMQHFTEAWTRWLGLAVIVLVVFDLGVIFFRLCGRMPDAWLAPADAVLTALLVPLTALLPAAVASLNGVRFQSECDRLAERSKVMAGLLFERS
ncbi:MAG TPA: hypothetical protein VGD78_07150, partial [Chthoniobacterales bacterium]